MPSKLPEEDQKFFVDIFDKIFDKIIDMLDCMRDLNKRIGLIEAKLGIDHSKNRKIH